MGNCVVRKTNPALCLLSGAVLIALAGCAAQPPGSVAYAGDGLHSRHWLDDAELPSPWQQQANYGEPGDELISNASKGWSR